MFASCTLVETIYIANDTVSFRNKWTRHTDIADTRRYVCDDGSAGRNSNLCLLYILGAYWRNISFGEGQLLCRRHFLYLGYSVLGPWSSCFPHTFGDIEQWRTYEGRGILRFKDDIFKGHDVTWLNTVSEASKPLTDTILRYSHTPWF